MAKDNARLAAMAFAIMGSYGGLVWACASAHNQINLNESAIKRTDDHLVRIERLLVAIAHKDGINVSVLFKKGP